MQSLDNQILIFGADSFKQNVRTSPPSLLLSLSVTLDPSLCHSTNRTLTHLNEQRKKRFAGHTVAGYACEPQFSPDGRFVSSGDGQGNMVFWDWKTCRITSRFKAHSKVVISSCWLPHETVSPFSTPPTPVFSFSRFILLKWGSLRGGSLLRLRERRS